MVAKTGSKCSFASEQAGIIDMVMDHQNPDILYASSWDRIRNNQESIVNGPNAKVFKSVDGGDNWTELGGGLPTDEQGRIGLTMTQQDPQHLYAAYVGTNNQLLDVFETMDGGLTWKASWIQLALILSRQVLLVVLGGTLAKYASIQITQMIYTF